jgi:hypothetical protein
LLDDLVPASVSDKAGQPASYPIVDKTTID